MQSLFNFQDLSLVALSVQVWLTRPGNGKDVWTGWEHVCEGSFIYASVESPKYGAKMEE